MCVDPRGGQIDPVIVIVAGVDHPSRRFRRQADRGRCQREGRTHTHRRLQRERWPRLGEEPEEFDRRPRVEPGHLGQGACPSVDRGGSCAGVLPPGDSGRGCLSAAAARTRRPSATISDGRQPAAFPSANPPTCVSRSPIASPRDAAVIRLRTRPECPGQVSEEEAPDHRRQAVEPALTAQSLRDPLRGRPLLRHRRYEVTGTTIPPEAPVKSRIYRWMSGRTCWWSSCSGRR